MAPQLKVTVRVDNRDWRTHLEQMHTYRSGIEEALVTTRVHLDKLHGDIARTLEKISSREKYLNSQLEAPLAELRTLSDSLAAAKEQYRQDRYLEGGKGYFFFALGFPPFLRPFFYLTALQHPFSNYLLIGFPIVCAGRCRAGSQRGLAIWRPSQTSLRYYLCSYKVGTDFPHFFIICARPSSLRWRRGGAP